MVMAAAGCGAPHSRSQDNPANVRERGERAPLNLNHDPNDKRIVAFVEWLRHKGVVLKYEGGEWKVSEPHVSKDYVASFRISSFPIWASTEQMRHALDVNLAYQLNARAHLAMSYASISATRPDSTLPQSDDELPKVEGLPVTTAVERWFMEYRDPPPAQAGEQKSDRDEPKTSPLNAEQQRLIGELAARELHKRLDELQGQAKSHDRDGVRIEHSRGFRTLAPAERFPEYWESLPEDDKMQGETATYLTHEQLDAVILLEVNIAMAAGPGHPAPSELLLRFMTDGSRFELDHIPPGYHQKRLVALLRTKAGDYGLLTLYPNFVVLELNGKVGVARPMVPDKTSRCGAEKKGGQTRKGVDAKGDDPHFITTPGTQ
jgi:hypothetical protein